MNHETLCDFSEGRYNSTEVFICKEAATLFYRVAMLNKNVDSTFLEARCMAHPHERARADDIFYAEEIPYDLFLVYHVMES